MKIILLATLVLLAPVAFAQDDKIESTAHCDSWKAMTLNEKIFFLAGYLTALDTVSEVDISKYWPKGHRVGSVLTELDVVCRTQNNTSKLGRAIYSITVEKQRPTIR